MIFYLFLSVCILLLILHFRKSKKHLPPGPRGLPILGNLLQLDKDAPYETLAQIAWKYGPVCGLRMGSVYTVLLTDPKLIRQAFAKDSFSGRAPLYLTHGIMKGYGLIAAEGERWREQRKFVASSIKNFGMVKFESPKRDKMEERILNAVNEALEKFESRQTKDGVNTHNILHHCIGNLMNLLTFGRVYDENDELWKWLQYTQEEADIYGAGVDTTLATIGWFLLFMAAYPDEQAKIQEEMDNILGENMPKLKHRPALIRLEAAIMEVQRIKSVVPTGIPHGTTEDTKIEDYDIPKGTMIIPVQWAVHMNPLYWPEPHTFKPERFIEKDGSLAKPDAFLPFQIGKRMCVGDEFARMILYLFGARILHQFSLSPPPGRTIDLETNSNGITLLPIPQKLCVKRRH
ncbi:cytochrome P450 2C23 isoform X3 [Phymastichus coffea]|uniref:cytochrome P450 2C23 isoform X3 n=1 Tax=Phymastichus coffea TaxID=108790 RepID=UPI00273BA38E|nr:cytochrome P450 2C23 isoform X3 [Phymastichus coffea]